MSEFADQLAKLASEVESAANDYRDFERAESMARNKTTDAKNRLNQAQRAIDEFLSKQRKDSPRDSDWWRAHHGVGR